MRTRTPPRTKERYILDSIPKIFKGGEWLEPAPENSSPAAENGSSQKGGEGVSDRGNGDAPAAVENYEQPLYVTVVGGQKYDERALYDTLERYPLRLPVVGAGRGVETDLARLGPEITKIEPSPDLYGKNARKVNVEQVLSFAPQSPLLLVGEGERVKQARAWLKRARWPREVIELP